MGVEKKQKPKRHRGRPFTDPQSLVDARFSMSFPRAREQELRDQAFRQGLHVSAFLRQTVLQRLDELAK